MKIFLIGFMGSGKSYWGRQLSQKLNLPFFDLDQQVINSAAKSINEIFEQDGEEYFRLLEKDTLHIISESHDSFIMACGGGAPCYFNNIEYMNQSGTTVWINSSFATLINRLEKEKEHRPLLRKMTQEQMKAFIIRKFSDRKIYYEQADVTVDDDNISLDQFVEKIFHA
jgi:shikimate kinase